MHPSTTTITELEMTRRRTAAALALATALAVVLGLPSFSSASFVARSTATATVGAAADWTPPTVTMSDPGASVRGNATLAATASDGETGIASVTVQFLSSAGTWTDVCTDTAAPYSCVWDTTKVADGAYALRARALDNAGYSTVSSTATTTVANNLLVVLSGAGDTARGTVPLTATLYSAGSVAYSVRFEYAPAGTTQWKGLCTDSTAPYTCDWITGSHANADYDLRAVAVAGSTSTSSATVTDVTVDNLAPAVSVADPGSPLRGTVALLATATDDHSGIARVAIQYASSSSTTWRDACVATDEPYSCPFDTTTLADGTYSFRAIASDVAGNTTTSAVITGRVIDNTVSSVSVVDPGAYLSGTVTVNTNANSTAGIAFVRIERAAAGSTNWTTLCTDTTAPYACAWDTTTVADGAYDLRAVLVDGAGRTTTSSVVSNRRVDNTPFRAIDVQTVNGGALAGRLDAGDQLVLTYSEVLNPGTVSTGWDGAPLAVNLRLRDGNVVGLGNKGDTLDVLRAGAAVNLGSVNLREDYIKRQKTAQFSATMTLSTVTVNGLPASRVTITAAAPSSGTGLKSVTTAAAMVWSPLAAVRSAAGRAVSTAPVTELGALDREF